MYVVMLDKRFDNPFDKPLFACTHIDDAREYIERQVKKDMSNRWAIDNWFNGSWTDKEIHDSFKSDYHITKVKAKL